MRNAILLDRWKIRLPKVNVLIMLWKWWIVVREKMQSCALYYDHGYCFFPTRVSGKILNQNIGQSILYPLCSLHFVPSLHFVSGLQSAFCTNRYPWHQYNLFLVRIFTLFCKNVDITYNVFSNPLSPPKKNSCIHSMPMFLKRDTKSFKTLLFFFVQ